MKVILVRLLLCLSLLMLTMNENGYSVMAKKSKKKKSVKTESVKGEVEDVKPLESTLPPGSPKRPDHIANELYCFTCQLVIDYSVQMLKTDTKEKKIKKVTDPEETCQIDNYFYKGLSFNAK